MLTHTQQSSAEIKILWTIWASQRFEWNSDGGPGFWKEEQAAAKAVVEVGHLSGGIRSFKWWK